MESITNFSPAMKKHVKLRFNRLAKTEEFRNFKDEELCNAVPPPLHKCYQGSDYTYDEICCLHGNLIERGVLEEESFHDFVSRAAWVCIVQRIECSPLKYASTFPSHRACAIYKHVILISWSGGLIQKCHELMLQHLGCKKKRERPKTVVIVMSLRCCYLNYYLILRGYV